MTLEEIQEQLQIKVPGCEARIVPNDSPSGQRSLRVDRGHARAAAEWLRGDPRLLMDFCSNVTGVDWMDSERVDKTKVVKLIDGVEKTVEETAKTKIPGYLEAVYHLFSMEKKTGPVILRVRTGNRTDDVTVPSLTPVWRSAEFQEREAFDLFGIVFEGHPDLRRILMWDGFADYPMRRDYVPEEERLEAPVAFPEREA